jgi:NADP-dependent 3-hydroxy acid dehydrogenase YdfG
MEMGWEVIGVTRRNIDNHEACTKVITNAQQTIEDAKALAELGADLVYLNAGAIEKEIGDMGQPLSQVTIDITNVNYTFPAVYALEAEKTAGKPMDIIVIGSIADGSPSCFGPVYHASKIAIHYFIQGTAPILSFSNPNIKLRLYKPGAIYGPLSWAPVNRLNGKGHKVRAKRCESAPKADRVAKHIEKFRKSGKMITKWDEPISFLFLKLFFAIAPNAYYKLQNIAWRKASKFAEKVVEE